MPLHISWKQLFRQPSLFWASLHGALRLEKRADPQGKKKIPAFANVILRNPIAWYIVVRLWTQRTSPVKKIKQHQNLKRNLIYFWHFFFHYNWLVNRCPKSACLFENFTLCLSCVSVCAFASTCHCLRKPEISDLLDLQLELFWDTQHGFFESNFGPE